MDSSRLRTVRCSSRLPGMGGVCPGGMSAWDGGVSAWGGGVSAHGVYTSPLRTEFLTHICENITFLQLRLRTVIIQENGLTTFAYHVRTVFDIVSGSWSVNLNIPV